MRHLLPLLALAACAGADPTFDLVTTTPDGGAVELSLTYSEKTCPLGVASPCYRYLLRFTPNSDFNPKYDLPAVFPRAELSPIPAESLRARLDRQLADARRRAQAINMDGVNQFLARESRGAFTTLCAFRMTLEPPAYGRVVLTFHDRTGTSLYRRDPSASVEQALSPGWTDRADDGHQDGKAWIWTGRFPAEGLPLDELRRGVTLRATLQPACRAAALLG